MSSNVFVCPGQKQLRSTGLVRDDGTMPYWASTKDCRACALKPRCTKGAKCIVTRNLFEAERELVRALKGTEAFERSARERRKVEMLFAHLKRNLGFRRLRLRGITGASNEFLLTATVQNLKKLARSLAYSPSIFAGCPAYTKDRNLNRPPANNRPGMDHALHSLPTSPAPLSRGSFEFFNGILDFGNTGGRRRMARKVDSGKSAAGIRLA
jgi:hypothetical protein